MARRRRDRRDRQDISADVLLVCEGADDCYLFDALRNLLGISEDAIQIETFAPDGDEGGKDPMPEYLRAIETRGGFGRVKALGLVLDADISASSTLDSVKGHLAASGFDGDVVHATVVTAPHGLNPGLSVGVFISPDGISSGAIEDLFIDAIREMSARQSDHAITCVDAFTQCVDLDGEMSSGRREKMRLYAWLSSRANPSVRPGQALRWGYLDFQGDAFRQACTFLEDLMSAANSTGIS